MTVPPRFPSAPLADSGSYYEESLMSSTSVSVQNKRQKKRSRSVSFSPTVKVHSVLHRRDMSVEEVQNTWTHRLERRQSRIAVENTIYLMKTGVGIQLLEADHFCSRGLEHYFCHVMSSSSSSSSEHDHQAKKSLKIALAMQRMLRRCGRKSPEMIARAYRSFTIQSRRVAYHKAEIDRSYVVESGP